MSHYVLVKTKITDFECLKQTLREMGINYEEAADAKDRTVVRLDGANMYLKLDDDGSFTAHALEEDPNTQAFLDELMQKYSLNKVQTEARKRGYNIVDCQKLQNGSLRLLLRRWVSDPTDGLTS